jgi:circadian clock protein KaiB
MQTDQPLELTLYISDLTPSARAQIDRLRQVLEVRWPGAYALEVRDIFDHPEAAAADTVFATPTLIKHLPLPSARIIGDLSNREQVLTDLALDEHLQTHPDRED